MTAQPIIGARDRIATKLRAELNAVQKKRGATPLDDQVDPDPTGLFGDSMPKTSPITPEKMIQVLATMGPAVDKLDLTKELAIWHGIGSEADAAGSSSDAPKKRKTEEWSPSLTADRAPMMKKRSEGDGRSMLSLKGGFE